MAPPTAGDCGDTRCPPSSKPDAKVQCAVKDPDNPSPLENYCYSTYTLTDIQGNVSNDLGCYTPPRAE